MTWGEACRLYVEQVASLYRDRRQVHAYETGEAPIPVGVARLAEAYDGGYRPGLWSSAADDEDVAAVDDAPEGGDVTP